MEKRTSLGAVACLLLACSASAELPLVDGAGQARALPQPGILLFWAAWCAPCRKEVDEIAALEKAALPLPIVVIAVDSAPVSRRLLAHLSPGQVRFPSISDDVLARMMPGAGGALPAALALDGEGRVCGRREGGLTTDILQSWRQLCAAVPTIAR